NCQLPAPVTLLAGRNLMETLSPFGHTLIFFRFHAGAIRRGRCHKRSMPGRFGRVFVEVALNASLSPCVPGPSSEGVSFVVSPYVVFGSGWSVDWLDAAFDCQARHCGLPAAEFLDGPGQGSEEGLGAAAPGALPDTPCGCAVVHPDRRAAILVRRLYRFRNPHHHRSRQGPLRLDFQRDDGASMVLVADRHRSGPAPSPRLRPVDFHGGELNSRALALALRKNTSRPLRPTCRSRRVQPNFS